MNPLDSHRWRNPAHLATCHLLSLLKFALAFGLRFTFIYHRSLLLSALLLFPFISEVCSRFEWPVDLSFTF